VLHDDTNVHSVTNTVVLITLSQIYVYVTWAIVKVCLVWSDIWCQCFNHGQKSSVANIKIFQQICTI